MDAIQTLPIVTPASPDDRSPAWPLLGMGLSVVVHAVLFWLLASTRIPIPVPNKKVDVEIVQVKKPPPPPKVEEKKPDPPKPPPVPPKVRLPPPPKAAPPPPKTPPPPPPPNTPPPPPKAAPPPINIGISLSSTTQGGSFAAPVGNTLYGQAPDKAANPSASQAYAAPPATAKFVPSYAVSEPPTAINGDSVKPEYPEGARKEGLEGQVTVKIKIDENGRVTAAKVVQGAGHGFDEKAVIGARLLRFHPAKLNGEAVATEITWVMTFLLN